MKKITCFTALLIFIAAVHVLNAQNVSVIRISSFEKEKPNIQFEMKKLKTAVTRKKDNYAYAFMEQYLSNCYIFQKEAGKEYFIGYFNIYRQNEQDLDLSALKAYYKDAEKIEMKNLLPEKH